MRILSIAALALCAAFTAPASAAETAKIFRYAFEVAETGFDPAEISDVYSSNVVANIFDTPLTYDYLARPLKLIPNTLAELPEVTENGTLYTLRVKPGIYFDNHDAVFKGRKRELTADDYVYSIKRIFDPKKRPGLAALLDAALTKPRPFDVLVIMNQSRLARRQRYAVDLVHDLTDAGVRIFHYQTGLERKMDTASDRFMVSVDGFSDESYRESIRITTRETMRRKAERGEVAGGKVYGFDNHRTLMGYVERLLNEQQATVLRRVFEMTAAGYGLVRIAKTFNRDGIPEPAFTDSGSRSSTCHGCLRPGTWGASRP